MKSTIIEIPEDNSSSNQVNKFQQVRLYFHQFLDHASTMGFFTGFLGKVAHLIKLTIDATILLASAIAGLSNIILMTLIELYDLAVGKIQENIKIRGAASVITLSIAIPALVLSICAVAPVVIPFLFAGIGIVHTIKEQAIIKESQKKFAHHKREAGRLQYELIQGITDETQESKQEKGTAKSSQEEKAKAYYSNLQNKERATVQIKYAKKKRSASAFLFTGAALLVLSPLCPFLAVVAAFSLFTFGVQTWRINKEEKRNLENIEAEYKPLITDGKAALKQFEEENGELLEEAAELKKFKEENPSSEIEENANDSTEATEKQQAQENGYPTYLQTRENAKESAKQLTSQGLFKPAPQYLPSLADITQTLSY